MSIYVLTTFIFVTIVTHAIRVGGTDLSARGVVRDVLRGATRQAEIGARSVSNRFREQVERVVPADRALRAQEEGVRIRSYWDYFRSTFFPPVAPPDTVGTCACYLALSLDIQWLQLRREAEANRIFPRHARLDRMPVRRGSEVAEELGGRVLLRYATEQHKPPTNDMVWTTVTPLCPRCSGPILHLPGQITERHWVFAIDPAAVAEIIGPRECIMGQGIEYILPQGYGEDALVPPGWGVRVR